MHQNQVGGAVLGDSSTNIRFTLKVTLLQINVLELKTIYFSLQSLCSNGRDTHLNIPTDNTTAVHSVSNMGRCKSLSCELDMRKIWGWTVMNNNFVTTAHIQGIMNVETDAKLYYCYQYYYYFHSILNNFRSNTSISLFVLR